MERGHPARGGKFSRWTVRAHKEDKAASGRASEFANERTNVRTNAVGFRACNMWTVDRTLIRRKRARVLFGATQGVLKRLTRGGNVARTTVT